MAPRSPSAPPAARAAVEASRAGNRAPDPAVLAAVEARLRAILDPYRDRLETGTIYNLEVLRRPGAKAHDWFAGVQPVDGAVKLNFLPMHAHPDLLDGIPPALRKCRTGASVLRFRTLDDALAGEVAALLARGFDAYMAGAYDSAGAADPGGADRSGGAGDTKGRTGGTGPTGGIRVG